MKNFIILKPQMRLAIAMYIRLNKLESVLHMIKPTLTLSPTGFVFLNITVLPGSSLGKTTTSVSVAVKKDFRFGFVQFYLFNRSFNAQPDQELTTVAYIRRSVPLPIGSERGVNVFYANGTIMPSATLFDIKREVRVGISPLGSTSTIVPSMEAYKSPPSAYTVAALVVVFSYFWLAISKAYERFQKQLILFIGLVILFVFGIRRFFLSA